MKKLLALVLAMVMTLGLATVSSSAAYSDAADVSLKEAVDVMSAVGVFQGSDGKFSPKANLNREQAAKLIAYLDLGESAAEALPAVQVFSDVPATSWSAKYIAYCADAGYIAGDGTGKFNPAGELNGYAFGKMLLCVLGYDADIEGFVGNTWSINVAKLMEKNDIADGIDAAASATLTREQAAQYCLNALEADMVDYENKGTNVTINGAVIATGASKAEKVEAAYTTVTRSIGGKDTTVKVDKVSYTGGDGDEVVQLCEKLYGTKLTKGTGNGDFGVIGNTWTYKAKKVGSYADETPVLTYTAGLKEKDLFTDLGKDGITGTYAKYIVLDEIWVDGVKVAVSEHVTDGDYYQAKASASEDAYESTVIVAKADKSDMAGPGNGVTTMIYEVKNSPNHYKMVCVKQYLTKITSVTKANATTGADRKVNTAYGSFETEDFAKDDKVLVTISAGEIQSMALVTKVENVAVTSYTGTSVTAGGTTYKYSQECAAFAAKGNYSMKSGDTYTFYLDANGYIIDGEAYSVKNTDYSYVLARKSDTLTTAEFDTKYEGKYQVVDMTGKVSTIKTLEDNATPDLAAGNYVTYEADEDNAGYMKIKKVYSADANAYSTSSKSTAGFLASDSAFTGFTKSAATQKGLSFNNSTVFVLKTGANTYKVVTGLSNMDNWTGLTSQTVNTITKDGAAVVAFLDCSTGASSSTSDKVVYVVSTTATASYDSDLKKTIYTYKTADGEVSATANNIFTGVGLWKIGGTADGYVKAATLIEDSAPKYEVVSVSAKKVEYSDGILTINGSNVVVTSNVAVTLIDNDDVVTADAGVEALVGDAVTGTFWMIENGENDASIKTIYFDGSIN